jgi:hypothetical protein
MPSPPPSPAKLGVEASADADGPAATANTQTMQDYREKMRAKFDAYMQERQSHQDENMRRQREKHDAKRQQSRTWVQSGPRVPPYPYPSTGGFGPRPLPQSYTAPYWQDAD